MDWKYYIPHVWEHERQVWEDVYLLPIDGQYTGQALWLTIDALGDEDDPECGSDRAATHAEWLRKLGSGAFHIDGTEMLVRSRDFSREELLDWVRIWLHENGLLASKLIEGSAEEFRGKAMHADLMGQLRPSSEANT